MTIPVPWSMKKYFPSVAPGWMSIPVLLCAHYVMILGISGTPNTKSSCAKRLTAITKNPG